MREFFRRIVHALEAGRPAELVTVAASEGSTPRGAGAMMAVFADGGTVGPCSANDRFCGVAGAVEDGFAAVQLQQGENSLVISYTPPLFEAGCILSAVSLAAAAALCFWRKNAKK